MDRIEKGLGLTGQPRAIVFHVKNGREHCHVVWSRIDMVNGKAVSLSHDRMKLRALARDLAREYGLKLPEGLEKDLKAQRGIEAKDRRHDRTERLQAAESGITPEERRAAITDLWRRSDGADAFRAALSQKGYVLASGDRRSYVVVDRYGHVHSLARQIEGARTRDVKAKMAALPPDKLPGVEEARKLVRERRKAADDLIRQRVRERLSDSLKTLAAKQRARHEKLLQAAQRTLTRQASEKLALDAAQAAEKLRPFTAAAIRVFALMETIPALRSILAPILRNPALNPLQRHRAASDSLERRHVREKRLLERQSQILHRQDAHERKALRSLLTRKLRAEERVRARELAEGYDQLAARNFVKERARLSASFSETSGAKAWRERQEKLAQTHGAPKKRRPRGYRLKPDEPS